MARMNTPTTDCATSVDSPPIPARPYSYLVVDFVLSLSLVLIFMGVAYWKGAYPQTLPWLKHDFRSHIGAEYDCIAQAIRKGRGFSDPFQIETGPTAWMPPMLPYAMAGIYWANSDDRSMVIFWMVALQGVSTWLACFILLRESRRLKHAVAGVLIAITIYSTNMYQLFQQTHDTGLLLLVVSLLWLGLNQRPILLLSNIREKSSIGFQPVTLSSQARSLFNGFSHPRLNQIIWGAWGAFCTLCSPVIGGAWFVIAFCGTRPRQRKWSELKGRSIAFGVWMLLISPWMIRNYVEFGKWFPIKSNGMYELWQSHCMDGDGVLDAQSSSGHPWPQPGEQRTRYQEIGEIEFIAEKGIEVRKSIRANPLGLLERIANRGAAALFFYMPFSQLDESYAGGWPYLFALGAHPLPLVSIVVLAIFGSIPMGRSASITIWLFGLLLLPYVLVSYYDRYAAMLVGLKMLLVLYGWDALKTALRERREASSEK